jgi:hypothetical protein
MKDSDFKTQNHFVGKGNTIASSGEEVSKGYKPDLTVKDSSGVPVFILESEQKTDRKAFLGDLMKAEMYAESERCAPELIIVMQVFNNTTTKQISEHIRPYRDWLAGKNGGTLNLSEIHVLSDTEYLAAISAGEVLGSSEFKNRGYVV